MASKSFSFRLPDEIVQFVESSQLDSETLNQTAQRLFIDFVKRNNPLSAMLSTNVDSIEELIDKRLEIGLTEVRSQLEAQLEELRGKLKAR
ncbi:hypothetical protein [uncultured Nostoc sp.]|uniref:hypothetical protein n=1 Tax=uncultured Nostoc sp. TaxID=340711 RepID=UPI0035CC941E